MYKKVQIKPQDIVILLKIISSGNDYGHGWNTITLARSLRISQSEISESLSRSKFAGFMESGNNSIFKKALLEFLEHGIKYAFPVRPAYITRGMPTAHSAPPLCNMIVQSNDIYVWPYEFGSTQGQAIEPLYKTVPEAASDDSQLYELLIFVDAIRVGRVREKEIAKKELEKRIIKGKLY